MLPTTKILKLSAAYRPQAWINVEETAKLICKGLVNYSWGDITDTLRGGKSRMTGTQSTMDIPAIIVVNGHVKEKCVPKMSNTLLFARDGFTCQYCGVGFQKKELTCDHVIPDSKGGPTSWTNCVTACKRCNHFKSDVLLEDIPTMDLIAVPFEPNLFEYFYLENRTILPDQASYLETQFKNIEKISC